MSETVTRFATVSFAATPVDEVSARHATICAAGWVPTGARGDPWAMRYEKGFPEGDPDPERELREIMGDYWFGADALGELRRSRDRAQAQEPPTRTA
jgi:hypothetical protein